MFFKNSTKRLALLVAVGVAAATMGSKLGAVFKHSHDASAPAAPKQQRLGSPFASTSDSEDGVVPDSQLAASAEPSIAIDKKDYLEGEPTTVEDAGSPSPGAATPSRVNPLLKYQKGAMKATQRQHAAVSKSLATATAKSRIVGGNELQTQIAAPGTEGEDSKEEAAEPSPGTIATDKEEYKRNEPVSIEFSIRSGEKLSKHRVGIFMRDSGPRGGKIRPVVSLPLCSAVAASGCVAADELTEGSVTFSSESVDPRDGAAWPIDLHQWGTQFDVYVLDGAGAEVLGPVMFNITNDVLSR